jgi:glutamyl-tRNA reductase
MDQVHVFGINWRHLPAAKLEAYTIPPEEQVERLSEMADVLGVSELSYLATCNRVELVCLLRAGQDPRLVRERIYRELVGVEDAVSARKEIRIWGGEGAIEHLFVVASGLDSAQVGEQEIAGQVRRSIERAREAGTLGPELLWIFEQVFKVAKRVQTDSGLKEGRLSLAEIAVDAVRQRLASNQQADEEPPLVALIGVSKMTRRCAESLSCERVRLLVVNRTLERAEELASQCGAVAMDLTSFLAAPPALFALVTATGSPDDVFGEQQLGRLVESCWRDKQPGPLLIDMAIPADVSADAAEGLGVSLIGMDELNEKAARTSRRREAQKAAARTLVDQALDDLRKKVAGRSLSPLIGELYATFSETANRDLDRVLSKRLPDLSDRQRLELEVFAQGLAKRLAHLPALGLRALAAESGLDTVRTFCTASNDPSTRRLHELACGMTPACLGEVES